MKRYIYIIVGIIVVAIVAILILLFVKDRSSTNSPTTSTTTGSLPTVNTQGSASGTQEVAAQTATTGLISLGSSSTTSATGSQGSTTNFGVLSSAPVLDYFVDAENNITAIQPNGEIITISNGQTSTLSSSTIDNIISASFSYDGKKILVSSGGPTNPQSAVFDVASQTWTGLPQGMQSPQWSSANYQIAYLSSVGTGQLALSLINVASLKSGVAKLLTLNANDMNLQWPTKTQFILSDKPTLYINGSSWLFDSQNDSLTPIVYETPGLESLWSHTTSTLGLIFSDGPAGQSQTLELTSLADNGTQQLNFLTLPSKCDFGVQAASASTTASSSYIALFCGIPRASSGFSSANLPDDYNTMALFTSDDIYKINTSNGVEQVLWNDQTQNMDVSDLKIFNNALFFVNRYDQKLYGLILGN